MRGLGVVRFEQRQLKFLVNLLKNLHVSDFFPVLGRATSL